MKKFRLVLLIVMFPLLHFGTNSNVYLVFDYPINPNELHSIIGSISSLDNSKVDLYIHRISSQNSRPETLDISNIKIPPVCGIPRDCDQDICSDISNFLSGKSRVTTFVLDDGFDCFTSSIVYSVSDFSELDEAISDRTKKNKARKNNPEIVILFLAEEPFSRPIIQKIAGEKSIGCGDSSSLTVISDREGGTYDWNSGEFSGKTIIVSPSKSTSYSVCHTIDGCKSDVVEFEIAVESDCPRMKTPWLDVREGTDWLSYSQDLEEYTIYPDPNQSFYLVKCNSTCCGEKVVIRLRDPYSNRKLPDLVNEFTKTISREEYHKGHYEEGHYTFLISTSDFLFDREGENERDFSFETNYRYILEIETFRSYPRNESKVSKSYDVVFNVCPRY